MADWVRVTFSAGGGLHRQVDLQIGELATIPRLVWDDGRPFRYVEQQVRLYIGSLKDENLFEVKDQGKGSFEVSHVWRVKEAEKDEVVKDVPGDNEPTKPDEPTK